MEFSYVHTDMRNSVELCISTRVFTCWWFATPRLRWDA